MGATEEAIREELIGAILGELSLLRRDVKELTQGLDASGRQFRDDGELTLLRFTARYEQFLREFSESAAGVLEMAGSFDEARDRLLGEIALRQRDEMQDRSRELLREVLGPMFREAQGHPGGGDGGRRVGRVRGYFALIVAASTAVASGALLYHCLNLAGGR